MLPYTVTNTSCPNTEDGAIDLELTGGIGPFTFAWSNGETTEDVNDLPAGTYTVEVTDSNGCVSNFSIDVGSEPDDTPPTITCPALLMSLMMLVFAEQLLTTIFLKVQMNVQMQLLFRQVD